MIATIKSIVWCHLSWAHCSPTAPWRHIYTRNSSDERVNSLVILLIIFGIIHIFPFHYILIKCSPVFNSDCVLLARNLWQKLHNNQKSEWRHSTARLKKEIKVAPAASKKEVKSWRLCKLKKKNSNSEKGKLKVKPLHAYKRTKAGWGERILLENVSTNNSFCIEWFPLSLSGKSCIVAAEKVWWRHSAQLFPTHERIPILETSCLNLFYRP